jgi:hypothetical protein
MALAAYHQPNSVHHSQVVGRGFLRGGGWGARQGRAGKGASQGVKLVEGRREPGPAGVRRTFNPAGTMVASRGTGPPRSVATAPKHCPLP